MTSNAKAFSVVEKLEATHDTDAFDCGKEPLDRFLKRFALIAGVRALLVHAKDDEARAWYEALDFEPSPTDPYHLFLLMKDLRALLRGRS